MTQTRGERNHNPLSINFIANPRTAFNGQVGIEIIPSGENITPRFGRYDTDFHGIRAGAKQLVTDNTRHGLKTLHDLIGNPTWGWAPAADNNNVSAYVNTVASHMGIQPDLQIDLTVIDFLVPAFVGFCTVENGRCLYDPELIESACRDALGLTQGPTS